MTKYYGVKYVTLTNDYWEHKWTFQLIRNQNSVKI